MASGTWYLGIRGGISIQCTISPWNGDIYLKWLHILNYCPELFSGLNYSAREDCWAKQREEKLAVNDAGSNVDDAGSKTRRRLCATIYLPANQPSRAFSNTNTQIKIHKYKYTNTNTWLQIHKHTKWQQASSCSLGWKFRGSSRANGRIIAFESH